MLTISNLTSVKKATGHVFTDLNLDFQEKEVSGNRRNSDVVSGNDLVVDYDIEAIKNSIRNILFQKRYLSNMNINLKKYIGQTISEMRALSMGEEIEKAIYLYEPRIKVEKIYVGVNIDQSTYYISMVVRILNFNSVISLNASFDKTGIFHFINI
jgi:phage baseplate assembly protein W